MTTPPPVTLIAGPYAPPVVRKNDWLDDERFGLVQVGGWTTALIAWPRRKKTGAHSPILTGDLVRAVRTESVAAICHWWGVSEGTVWAWRKALGVDTTEGSQRITRRGVPPEAAARGRARSLQPDVIARRTEKLRGRHAHPNTRAALLAAASAPKPEGWGTRANRWMIEAKIADGTQTGITFLVEVDPAGGYTARAIGPSIHTAADTIDALRAAVDEAVLAHFGRKIPALLVRPD